MHTSFIRYIFLYIGATAVSICILNKNKKCHLLFILYLTTILCKTFRLFDLTLNVPQMMKVIPEDTCRVH